MFIDDAVVRHGASHEFTHLLLAPFAEDILLRGQHVTRIQRGTINERYTRSMTSHSTSRTLGEFPIPFTCEKAGNADLFFCK